MMDKDKTSKELLDIILTLGHDIIFYSLDRIKDIRDEKSHFSEALLYWTLLEAVRPMHLTLLEAGIKQFGEEFKELVNSKDDEKKEMEKINIDLPEGMHIGD